MPARTTDWRSIVIQADPDWNKDQRLAEEYRFSGTGGGSRTHEGAQRVFRGDPLRRGPYAPELDDEE